MAPTDSATPTLKRQAIMLLVFLVVAIAAGLLGNLLQGSDVSGRYLRLDRPVWAPPAGAFGVVWPVLYVLIGIAGWLAWRSTGPEGWRGPLVLWGLQLVVNAIWPGVFFGLEAYWPAVAVIVVLVVLISATMTSFVRHQARLAAWLLVPYLLWIVYATALNVAIAAAN